MQEGAEGIITHVGKLFFSMCTSHMKAFSFGLS